ncbi:hypothetical protein MZD45_09830, partial [Escherichia coli]|nr:hypothetical protein [Escherichia coli]
MSHRARHQLLALPGIIFLVLFPIILSLWIAFLWAKSEVNNQLRTFAQLALDKSELVIRQADLVLMNPLMILVKIIKLRWIHILSYDQMV